jgi:hypothetical protein
MIHLDIKKLGKINGIGHRITGDRRGQSNLRSRGKGPSWEYVHVAIDDASRIAFAKIMANERKRSATTFLRAAVAYYESLGIKVERMTDNGSGYKSAIFRRACKKLKIKHIRDQALHAQDQRQGGALHPDLRPGVGLCASLSPLASANRPAASMAASIQLAPTARRDR